VKNQKYVGAPGVLSCFAWREAGRSQLTENQLPIADRHIFISHIKCIHPRFNNHEPQGTKEAFVTGHSGTSASEILLVCVSAPIGYSLL
jgi:hypothetical protein